MRDFGARSSRRIAELIAIRVFATSRSVFPRARASARFEARSEWIGDSLSLRVANAVNKKMISRERQP
jgi:hypothetical protein